MLAALVLGLLTVIVAGGIYAFRLIPILIVAAAVTQQQPQNAGPAIPEVTTEQAHAAVRRNCLLAQAELRRRGGGGDLNTDSLRLLSPECRRLQPDVEP